MATGCDVVVGAWLMHANTDRGLAGVGDDNDNELSLNREYVVRLETLTTLSVMVKFLGFVVGSTICVCIWLQYSGR